MAANGIDNKTTVTITFGDRAENHIGMQQIDGKEVTRGFTVGELEEIKQKIDSQEDPRYTTELVRLNEAIPGVDVEEAAVLIVRNGVNMLLERDGLSADEMLREQLALDVDKQYWDTRNKRVQNKQARWNLCFAEDGQDADFQNKKGTIVAFRDVPCVQSIREKLGELCGDLGADLCAEGNYYYDPTKTGIGFHGDAERWIVIGVRLGPSIPLNYQWFYRYDPIGERVNLTLNHGDFYIMSEKAVGRDWRSPSKVTLRHAAGSAKYLTIDDKKVKDRAARRAAKQETAPRPVLTVQPPRLVMAVQPIVVPAKMKEETEPVVLKIKPVNLVPVKPKPEDTNGSQVDFATMLLGMSFLQETPVDMKGNM